jgi:hypothetical protein
MQPIRWAVQVSSWMGWNRLFDTAYGFGQEWLTLIDTFLELECDSLSDGEQRRPRSDDNSPCECKDGWEGINCNGWLIAVETSKAALLTTL